MLKKILATLILGIALATTSCTQPAAPDYGPPIVKQFDRGAKTIELRVVIYDSYAEVTAAKKRFDHKQTPELYGWSGWSKEEPGQCVLHVKKAEYYRDPEFETWGHELAHCLYGDYHGDLTQPVDRLGF